MTQIKVELIDSAGGDLSVVNSARVSFAKEVTILGKSDEKLIKYLADHRHDTPFRHNFIQLRCKVPLFLARQLMKHQAGLTWNEESRRYVDSRPDFYFPEEWRGRPDGSIKQGSAGVVDTLIYEFDTYNNESPADAYEYATRVSLDIYKAMINSNVAPEMARMVLPQSMMVNFIWTGNLLAFAHVYSLRSGEGAQEEAKEFSKLLDKAIKHEFPVSWKVLTGRT